MPGVGDRRVLRRRCSLQSGGRRRLAVLWAAGAVALLPGGRAIAAIDSWAAPTGGNWSDGAKWSAAVPPAAGDDALISNSLSSGQTITYDYSGPAITLSSVTIDSSGSGSYMLAMSAHTLTVNTAQYVGYSGTGNFNQSGGTNNIVGNSSGLYVGYAAGSSGFYTLSSAGALNAATEYVGFDGSGNFNQAGGTNTLSAGGTLYIGAGLGTGAYALAAGASLGGGDVYVGQSGNGNFNQAGGGNSPDSLFVAALAGSSGTYTLSGGTLSPQGNEFIGDAGTGNFNQTVGANTLSGFNGVYLGALPGGTGTYTLGGSATLTANVEYVGLSGSGVFNQTGGTNTLSGSGAALTVGKNSGATGTYTLAAGAVLNGATEFIGASGAGNFNQTGGSNTLAAGTSLYVGAFNSGSYTLGAGSLSANTEYIGHSAAGRFNQTGGANSLSGSSNLFVGFNPGATGTYTLSGGSLSIGGTAYVGGSTSAPGGAGTITVNPGGNLTAGGMQIWNHGNVILTGGVTVLGSLQISNGGLLDVTTSSLTINYGGGASPNAAIRNYISSAYNVSATPWSGTTGITSSSAALDKAHHSVAFADGSDTVAPGNPQKVVTNLPPGRTTFAPGGTLASGVELVTYAFAGDANLDGKVDFSDFIILSNHFGAADINWDHGNFNYDANVDFFDFIVLSNNFGSGTSAGSAAGATPRELSQYNALAESFGISQSQIAAWDATISNLPEPGSIGFVGICAVGLMRRRRGIKDRS